MVVRQNMRFQDFEVPSLLSRQNAFNHVLLTVDIMISAGRLERAGSALRCSFVVEVLHCWPASQPDHVCNPAHLDSLQLNVLIAIKQAFVRESPAEMARSC